MPAQIVEKDEQYVLNHCTKFLARQNIDRRHDFAHLPPDDDRARICEPWRFPVVDSHLGQEEDAETAYWFNDVTFVYLVATGEENPPSTVAVVGTFAGLYESVPLRPVNVLGQQGRLFAVTVAVPKGEVHLYKLLVDGDIIVDPVNPQQVVLENGRAWSRFFTANCAIPITFEYWERVLLDRLTDHILPFRTTEGRNFLGRYYIDLDKQTKATEFQYAYRLDESVGAVNYIDKLLAKEERHHLGDYRTCLSIIDRVLRQRNPYVEPSVMSKELYVELYDQMASGDVPGWDYGRYENPRYFLQLLRRHTFTGAFCHPKYGGNAGAAGWAYLEERYRDQEGATLFKWRKAIEPPLGTSKYYRG